MCLQILHEHNWVKYFLKSLFSKEFLALIVNACVAKAGKKSKVLFRHDKISITLKWKRPYKCHVSADLTRTRAFSKVENIAYFCSQWDFMNKIYPEQLNLIHLHNLSPKSSCFIHISFLSKLGWFVKSFRKTEIRKFVIYENVKMQFLVACKLLHISAEI